MTPYQFVEEIRGLDFSDTFNPYSDHCERHDLDDAPRLRSESLLAVLKAATKRGVDSMWIGRDLGYRGGRRTGLALTDDVHFLTHAGRWDVTVEKPTKSEMAERTATVIWSALERVKPSVFLWNVFPLHPHQANDPFTNRAHNVREREAGEELLSELVRLLKPRRLIPVGNDAASVTFRLYDQRKVFKVRHPSYGGQNEFRKQIREIYRFPPKEPSNLVTLSRDLLFESA